MDVITKPVSRVLLEPITTSNELDVTDCNENIRVTTFSEDKESFFPFMFIKNPSITRVVLRSRPGYSMDRYPCSQVKVLVHEKLFLTDQFLFQLSPC